MKTDPLKNKTVLAILDRTTDIYPLFNKIKKYWKYNILDRKPHPALNEDCEFIGTNLDIVCILSALADIESWINIPEYALVRERTHHPNQTVISEKNRHGKVIRVEGNKNNLSLNVLIKDKNVIDNTNIDNDPYRKFAITNMYGYLYEGWNTIEFQPPEEWKQHFKKFKVENEIGKIEVQYAVHPAIVMSYFGTNNSGVQSLIQRTEEELL